MQQYIVEISNVPDATKLINYIKSLSIVKKVKLLEDDIKLQKKQKQKLILKNDLKNAFNDVKLMQAGKKKKRTLSNLIDEL